MRDTIGNRGIYGVLVPYFNTVVEPELAALQPSGVSNQTARFLLDADVLDHVNAAADGLASCNPDALLVGLATESIPGGLELLAQAAADAGKRTGRPVFTASHATHAALAAIGAKSIAVATPFDDSSNQVVQQSFAAVGIAVTDIAGLACPDIATIGSTPRDQVVALFRSLRCADADAVVQVGTGLPTLADIEAIEAQSGKIVVTSNTALYWQALRSCGVDDRLKGSGRLLREY